MGIRPITLIHCGDSIIPIAYYHEATDISEMPSTMHDFPSFRKEVIDQKESAGSDQHRIKHQAGSCRTDQDTIPQEGGKAGKRNSQHPIEIGSGLLYDNRVIRQEGEKTFPAYSIKQGKRKGQPNPPAKQQTDHPTKGCFVPSTDITSRQSLARIGKTVHDIGEKRKQLHQQCINSQNDIALSRTRRSKNVVTATKQSVRKKISPFTWKKRRIATLSMASCQQTRIFNRFR